MPAPPDKPFLIADIPRLIQLTGHFKPVPFYISHDMFGGLPFDIAGGDISNLVGQPVAELHTHDCGEIYFLISPHAAGAEISIEIEGTLFRAKSPSVFYVPAGQRHRFITCCAEPGSYCFGILLSKGVVHS